MIDHQPWAHAGCSASRSCVSTPRFISTHCHHNKPFALSRGIACARTRGTQRGSHREVTRFASRSMREENASTRQGLTRARSARLQALKLRGVDITRFPQVVVLRETREHVACFRLGALMLVP